MKIKRVKWNNHPILGDLELDFSDASTGIPYNNILLAGENGTGKTSILESISTFLNRGTFEFFDYIEYVVGSRVYKAVQATNPNHKPFFDIIDDAGTTTMIRSDINNNPQEIETNTLDIRHYGCVFSKARADYKTAQISSTTTKQLDVDKYDKDNEDDFTSLKQLVVDVENQDNSEYAEENKALGETPKPWNDFYLTSKIYRFKSAFDNFFEKIKYDKVQDNTSEKSILFNKNGKSISIDKLSTGEKQIVFRGIYLLKNGKNLDGAAIMIDEPELSLHPKWQQKILKYYKDLFIEAGTQKTQLLIATHSDYVLKEALTNKNENIVIVLKEVSGIVVAQKIDAPSVLPSITNAETNYLAFDIVSNDYHIELYGYLQTRTRENTVKRCDTYIKSQSQFNASIHSKSSANPSGTTYDTLSTFIRNAIDHPGPLQIFTEAELRTSTELLIELCR